MTSPNVDFCRFNNFNGRCSKKFILKSFYQIPLTWSKTYRGYVLSRFWTFCCSCILIQSLFYSLKLPNTKVFLHQRDTFWETTTQSPGILINDQTISQVQIKYDDIRTLASESNDCSYYKQGRVHNLHMV